MKRLLVLILSLFGFVLPSFAAVEVKMVPRDPNLEVYPSFEIHNPAATPARITIESSLETPEGKVKQGSSASYEVAAGATATFPAYKGEKSLRGEIDLLRTSITEEGGAASPFSAICGTPRPVGKGGDRLVGMNVHLERFTAEEQWKCLQMMKAAGVTTIRLEPGFRMPDAQGNYMVSWADPLVLDCEAFGMAPLMALTYFPKEFYAAPEKGKLAYAWAKAMGEHYKGRVIAWHYGNEANSGWATFGDAADMLAHNNAMALGTLAADPENMPASFGIAEALPNYTKEFFRLGGGANLKALALHPYCGVPESGIAKLLDNRRIIDEYGGHQEIWATEIGFQYSLPGAVNPVTQQMTQVDGFSLDQQADGLARLFLMAKAKGIERIYWYDFFGKKDRETFWIVDEDFTPRPAYEALKVVGNLLKGAAPLGGTEATEPVQYQLFRRPDGSVFLAAWALRDGTERDLHLPLGAYTVRDILGKSVAFDPAKPTVLNERPIIIEGLSPATAAYALNGLQVNALDVRNWGSPLHRWSADPGTTLTIPFVAFNSTSAPLKVYPSLLRTFPGWKVTLPEPFVVEPGQTVSQPVAVVVPSDATPGVDYHLAFAGETPGPRRAVPYEARIWVNGKFPYTAILDAVSPAADVPPYKSRRVIDENVVGFGRETLGARHATATADGELSEWKPEEFVTIDQVGNWRLRDPGLPGRDEWYARVALRWDSKALHAAFVVRDNELNLLDLISRDWRDSDNVRLFLSTEDAAKRAKRLTEKDYLILMTPTRQFHTEPPAVMAAAVGGFAHQGFESKVTIASRVWDGGYVIEVTIPFEALGVTAQAGKTLGCNIMADDAFRGYRRYTGLTFLKDFSYWNNPQTLGTLKLLP
ncbi:Carbohydrate family 9 binding domain-like [Verrucomicrobium sp. GAS474]|uniref:sugar-binding protein n=1 Tax=Verrucomicrobium sp. GAS474 TaxID=1882831 RepID=UPI000879C3A7|nr:sugar-binding protein [Verrucomicrobium sp. GAS474]SDU11835.1 Carbohydrate family 9 binding domain-like [Verrucomicrobium sp. GAS474]